MLFEVEILLKMELFFSTFLTFKFLPRDPGSRDPTFYGLWFCAFGIYSLKALAFARQLNLENETVEALKRFCRFTSTIYIPHFLAS